MREGSQPSPHRAAAAAATLVALTFGLAPERAPGSMQAVPSPVGSPASAAAFFAEKSAAQPNRRHLAEASVEP